jgi:hypothetical protein
VLSRRLRWGIPKFRLHAATQYSSYSVYRCSEGGEKLIQGCAGGYHVVANQQVGPRLSTVCHSIAVRALVSTTSSVISVARSGFVWKFLVGVAEEDLKLGLGRLLLRMNCFSSTSARKLFSRRVVS